MRSLAYNSPNAIPVMIFNWTHCFHTFLFFPPIYYLHCERTAIKADNKNQCLASAFQGWQHFCCKCSEVNKTNADEDKPLSFLLFAFSWLFTSLWDQKWDRLKAGCLQGPAAALDKLISNKDDLDQLWKTLRWKPIKWLRTVARMTSIINKN